jgi:hypothetical protein
MDLQEMFDRVVTHLLTQNARSSHFLKTGEQCLYRGPEGRMCAIGCLIPDEIYNPEMEVGFEDLLERPAIKELFPTRKHECLGLRLQMIHDRDEPSEWRHSLQQTATKYELAFNPPAES